jgi:hypothetical protein
MEALRPLVLGRQALSKVRLDPRPVRSQSFFQNHCSVSKGSTAA